MIEIIREKLRKYGLYDRDVFGKLLPDTKFNVTEEYFDGRKMFLVYNQNMAAILTSLGFIDQFDTLKISWYEKLFNHVGNYSLVENVEIFSLRINTDWGFKAECGIDHFNPKYGWIKHLLIDILSLKDLYSKKYRKEFFKCVKLS